MKEDQKPTIVIYTDGACIGNPGKGGWGALLQYDKQEKELFGGQNMTTNNQMELQAAISALAALKRPCHVKLYTDSTYLKKGMSDWIQTWKEKGWHTANKKPVKNKILWQQLDKLAKIHDIQWLWVKGHNGDPGNERADQLANQGIKTLDNQ